MKYVYNPFDFWTPTFQAATVIAEANMAVTLRMMDMATTMNPYIKQRPSGPCAAAPRSSKTAARRPQRTSKRKPPQQPAMTPAPKDV